jgi:hypothetical protein
MNEAHEPHNPAPETRMSSNSGQPSLHFTPEEWEQYRQSDKSAARSVVLLMGAIFTIGLILYSSVAYVCWFKLM